MMPVPCEIVIIEYMKTMMLLLMPMLVSCDGSGTEGAAAITRAGGPEIVKQSDATLCFVEPTPELKARLSPDQWEVLVNAATEPPFRNAYWDNHRAGIYVDAIDGTPLFSSLTKFDSGSGWPSFWDPIDPGRLLLVEDDSLGMRRVEVRARASGGHLGHVFEDGPAPTGLRYCINSASLRFIDADSLEEAGYGDLLPLFSAEP